VVEAAVLADDDNHMLDGCSSIVVTKIGLRWFGGECAANRELEYHGGYQPRPRSLDGCKYEVLDFHLENLRGNAGSLLRLDEGWAGKITSTFAEF